MLRPQPLLNTLSGMLRLSGSDQRSRSDSFAAAGGLGRSRSISGDEFFDAQEVRDQFSCSAPFCSVCPICICSMHLGYLCEPCNCGEQFVEQSRKCSVQPMDQASELHAGLVLFGTRDCAHRETTDSLGALAHAAIQHRVRTESLVMKGLTV